MVSVIHLPAPSRMHKVLCVCLMLWMIGLDKENKYKYVRNAQLVFS